MRILYGCCYKADLNLPNIDYVDIIPNLKKSNNCNYICDSIENIDFNNYDVILCSPPCNYYSRCNYRRDISAYSLSTKHLLPLCINKAVSANKPFIIENVRNKRFMYNLDIPKTVLIYEYGRHTYFTNVLLDFSGVEQRQDFKNGGYVIKYPDMNNRDHQGGYNVNNCFKWFLSVVLNKDLLGVCI